MEKKIKIIATNKKAYFNYFIIEVFEAGIALKGTEIKSLRVSGASIGDSYVVIKNDEAEVLNMHIKAYDHGNIFNHDPLRTRKLLLHKKEILYLKNKIKSGGFTIVPTKLYFSHGNAKLEVALAKGKKLYDKRETIKERDEERERRRQGDERDDY